MLAGVMQPFREPQEGKLILRNGSVDHVPGAWNTNEV